jgi:hypothetical protein
MNTVVDSTYQLLKKVILCERCDETFESCVFYARTLEVEGEHCGVDLEKVSKS